MMGASNKIKEMRYIGICLVYSIQNSSNENEFEKQ